MVEHEIIVIEERINYEGLFSIDEVHKLITEYLQKRHYDLYDKLQSEAVRPEGKDIDIQMEPEKNIDDYTAFLIKIRIFCTHLKDVTVEQDGRKRRLNDGKVQIVFDAFLRTDYQHRMASKPVYHVLKTIFDKYIFKTSTAKHEQALKDDVAHLKDQVANYLNLWKKR